MHPTDNLFYLEPIAEIIETCICSAFIDGTTPISSILVGPSGSAKSKILKRYADSFIHQSDSVSSQGLWEMVQRDQKSALRFIIIPDFNPTLSRKPSTSASTVSNLLTLTNDGTVRIDDGRQTKEGKHDPMGILTACTPEVYEKNAKHWFALGLRRRIIPIFYTYTTETENKLQQLVRKGRIQSAMLPPKKMNLIKKVIPRMSNDFAIEIERLSNQLAINLGKLAFHDGKIKRWTVRDVVPVSPHITIRTLATAHAIRRGSKRVQNPDIKFVTTFVDFTDPESPRKI